MPAHMARKVAAGEGSSTGSTRRVHTVSVQISSETDDADDRQVWGEALHALRTSR